MPNANENRKCKDSQQLSVDVWILVQVQAPVILAKRKQAPGTRYVCVS
jgi:hypothetical protein